MSFRIIPSALFFLLLHVTTVNAYVPSDFDDIKSHIKSKSAKNEAIFQHSLDMALPPVLVASLETDGIAVPGVTAEPDGADSEAEQNNWGEDDFGLEEEFKEASLDNVFDPLGGYNRFMTSVNDKLYFWVVKPVARGYGAAVPLSARRSVVKFFNNLLFPVRFINNVLQLKFKRAGIELVRFCVNTTAGVLGFGDPARNWFSLEAYPEDFGQTLGRYGVGSGFHIVLPLLGPSNLRDLAGLFPDYFLDPVSQIKKWEEELAVKSYDRLNDASLHIGEYESIKKDALDLYPFLRDAYEQNRNQKIKE